MPNSEHQKDLGLFKGVMTAYAVLVLHLVLIAAMGLLVLFFRGFVSYMLWIFLAGILALTVSAVYFFRRLKAQGRSLKEALRSPLFNGRPVEISLFGGLASFRMGPPDGSQALETDIIDHQRQLEDPAAVKMRELNELVRLLEEDLISRDEYDHLKNQLMRSKSQSHP